MREIEHPEDSDYRLISGFCVLVDDPAFFKVIYIDGVSPYTAGDMIETQQSMYPDANVYIKDYIELEHPRCGGTHSEIGECL